MRYGSPYGSGFGNPENEVAYIHAERAAGRASVRLTFRPVTGRGNAWFGVYRNSRFVRNVYAAEGADAGPFEIPIDRGETESFFAVIRLGALSDPAYHIERVARTFETGNSQLVTLTWKWLPDIVGNVGDSGQTSNWAFAGISYSATLPRAQTQGNWSALRLDIVVDATTVTLNLYRQNTLVASGSELLAALPGPVTLAEVNGSGVAASCQVGAGPVTTLGAEVIFRWPASMKIRRGPSPVETVVVDTTPFNNADSGIWTEPEPLDPDTYYYALEPVSDTGEDGDMAGLGDVTIYGPPEPPTNLHYNSGNAAATVLHWTASATPGATYNVYTADDGAAFDLNAPEQTLPAGSTSATLSAFAGSPGKRCVLVRAEN